MSIVVAYSCDKNSFFYHFDDSRRKNRVSSFSTNLVCNQCAMLRRTGKRTLTQFRIVMQKVVANLGSRKGG